MTSNVLRGLGVAGVGEYGIVTAIELDSAVEDKFMTGFSRAFNEIPFCQKSEYFYIADEEEIEEDFTDLEAMNPVSLEGTVPQMLNTLYSHLKEELNISHEVPTVAELAAIIADVETKIVDGTLVYRFTPNVFMTAVTSPLRAEKFVSDSYGNDKNFVPVAEVDENNLGDLTIHPYPQSTQMSVRKNNRLHFFGLVTVGDNQVEIAGKTKEDITRTAALVLAYHRSHPQD